MFLKIAHAQNTHENLGEPVPYNSKRNFPTDNNGDSNTPSEENDAETLKALSAVIFHKSKRNIRLCTIKAIKFVFF